MSCGDGGRMGDQGTEVFLHLEWFANSLTLESFHCLRLASSLTGIKQGGFSLASLLGHGQVCLENLSYH